MQGVTTYQPKCVESGAFEGNLKIKGLTFDERMDVLSGMSGADEKTRFDQMRALVKRSKDLYVEVALKRLSDGALFKSFDDLQYGADCHEILLEVANGLIGGFARTAKEGGDEVP